MNTQKSYRDTFALLLPFVSTKVRRPAGHPRLRPLRRQPRSRHVEWSGHFRATPSKKATPRPIAWPTKIEIDAMPDVPDRKVPRGRNEHALLQDEHPEELPGHRIHHRRNICLKPLHDVTLVRQVAAKHVGENGGCASRNRYRCRACRRLLHANGWDRRGCLPRTPDRRPAHGPTPLPVAWRAMGAAGAGPEIAGRRCGSNRDARRVRRRRRRLNPHFINRELWSR